MQTTSPTVGAVIVRGLTGKNVVNYVDGARFTNGAQRGGINTFFDLNEPSGLQSVEVLRGPNSAQFGSDSLGGTVNLLTKSTIYSSNKADYSSNKAEFPGAFNPFFNSVELPKLRSTLLGYGTNKLGGYVNLAAHHYFASGCAVDLIPARSQWFFIAFENIFDHSYRNPSRGIGGAGRSLPVQYRYKF